MARGRGSETFKQAQSLASRKGESLIDLAEAVWELRDKQPGSLGDFVAATRMSRRKLYYLLDVWDRFGELDIPRQQLVAVGWTKLAILAKKCPQGKEKAGVKLAAECTAKELPLRLKGGPKRAKAHSILLRLNRYQYREFEAALMQNGATWSNRAHGLVGKERALIRALGVYLVPQLTDG